MEPDENPELHLLVSELWLKQSCERHMYSQSPGSPFCASRSLRVDQKSCCSYQVVLRDEEVDDKDKEKDKDNDKEAKDEAVDVTWHGTRNWLLALPAAAS